jgi:hypothetical protein
MIGFTMKIPDLFKGGYPDRLFDFEWGMTSLPITTDSDF